MYFCLFLSELLSPPSHGKVSSTRSMALVDGRSEEVWRSEARADDHTGELELPAMIDPHAAGKNQPWWDSCFAPTFSDKLDVMVHGWRMPSPHILSLPHQESQITFIYSFKNSFVINLCFSATTSVNHLCHLIADVMF